MVEEEAVIYILKICKYSVAQLSIRLTDYLTFCYRRPRCTVNATSTRSTDTVNNLLRTCTCVSWATLSCIAR